MSQRGRPQDRGARSRTSNRWREGNARSGQQGASGKWDAHQIVSKRPPQILLYLAESGSAEMQCVQHLRSRNPREERLWGSDAHLKSLASVYRLWRLPDGLMAVYDWNISIPSCDFRRWVLYDNEYGLQLLPASFHGRALGL